MRTGPVLVRFLFAAAHRLDSRANALHNDVLDAVWPTVWSGNGCCTFSSRSTSTVAPRGGAEAVQMRAQASVLLRRNHHPVCLIMCVIVWMEEMLRLGRAALSGSS